MRTFRRTGSAAYDFASIRIVQRNAGKATMSDEMANRIALWMPSSAHGYDSFRASGNPRFTNWKRSVPKATALT